MVYCCIGMCLWVKRFKKKYSYAPSYNITQCSHLGLVWGMGHWYSAHLGDRKWLCTDFGVFWYTLIYLFSTFWDFVVLVLVSAQVESISVFHMPNLLLLLLCMTFQCACLLLLLLLCMTFQCAFSVLWRTLNRKCMVSIFRLQWPWPWRILHILGSQSDSRQFQLLTTICETKTYRQKE